MEYTIGQVIEGTVTGLQPYGAFVALDETTQGLIHISEVKHGFTKDIHSVLSVGKLLQVKIIDIDEYTEKISLSLRALDAQAPMPAYKRKRYFTNHTKKIGFESLAESMPVWIEHAMKELSRK